MGVAGLAVGGEESEMTEQTLYVFWKYDLCPYILGAKVHHFLPDGRVEPEGFPGYAFTPLAILPSETGVSVKAEIERLKDRYREDDKDLRARYRSAARGLIGLEGGT